MSRIEARSITKRYEIEGKTVDALRGVSLEVNSPEFVTIVGRSGSGKTTLLRILAGLEAPTSGEVRCDGRLCTPGSPMAAGMVFQEPRLMPWLSVLQNVLFAFPPSQRGPELRSKAVKMIKLVGLAGYEEALPGQLSGGMAQRVALGRAMLREPETILLDEPLGALDYFTRRTMQRELLRLYHEENRSFVMVTHDVGEALRLGTRVIVLRDGLSADEIEVGLPYPRPRSTPVFQLLIDRVLAAIGDEDR